MAAFRAPGSLHGIATKLKTNLRSRLTIDEAHPNSEIWSYSATTSESNTAVIVERRRVFWDNEMPERPTPLIKVLLSNYHAYVTVLLAWAAILSVALGLHDGFLRPASRILPAEPNSIAFILLIAAAGSVLTDYNQRRTAKVERKKRDAFIEVTVAMDAAGTLNTRHVPRGFSMGIAGRKVALEASDIVLLDYNFDSTANMERWMKAVEAIKRYVTWRLFSDLSLVIFYTLDTAFRDNQMPILPIVLDIARLLLLAHRPAVISLPSLAATAHHAILLDQHDTPSRSASLSWPKVQRRMIPRFMLTCVVLSHCASTAAAADLQNRLLSPLRVGSGVAAAGSSVAIIPLRTVEGVSRIGWIITYVIWAVCFILYLGMQLMLIPREKKYRRRMFLFCVVLATVHFSIGLSAQSETTVTDGFTIFGPLIATISTYLVSLLLVGSEDGGRAPDAEDSLTFAAWMGLCG